MDKNSVGRGVIILALTSIILKLLSALYLPILAQILTDDGIAVYSVAYKVFVFLFAITSMGFQPAITKLVSEERVTGSYESALAVLKTSKKILLIYGGVVSLLFAICAVPLSKIFNSEESILSFIFLSPAIVFAAVLSAYRGYFQGYNDMTSLGLSNVVEQLLNVIFSLFFAFKFMEISIGWGSAGGTIGTTVGSIGAIIYINHILNKKYLINISSKDKSANNTRLHTNKIVKTLFAYAIPFTLVAAIQNITGIIDIVTVRTFIANNINIKTATLEYYTTIINVPLVIIISLGIAIFPKIIKSFIEKNKEELTIQTAYCYKIIYMITIPAVCGLSILSKEIFKFIFNRDFGYEILLIGSISLIFMALSAIQNIILQGMNKFKFIIRVGLLALAVKIFFNITLIRIENINVIGAVIGSIISFILITVLNHIKLEKSFNIKIPIIKQAKAPVIASIIMSISLLLLKYQIINKILVDNYTRLNVGIATLVLVAVGGIIYSLAMLLLGGVSKYELDTISPKIYELIPSILKKKIS